jgi:hypothetical protein
MRKAGEQPPALFLCLPAISARLADAHGNVFTDEFLTLRSENLHDQCREGQEKPLKWKPPPTDQQPPEASPVLVF